MIDEFTSLIPLYGESYEQSKKLMVYSLLANALKENLIKIGKETFDLRINVAVVIKSGHGKHRFKLFAKNTIGEMNRKYSEPTSLHPEQLVGKVIISKEEDGNKEVVFNKGYLADDFLVLEEAIELLRDTGYQIARNYLNIALDPIGDNTITKRSVSATQAEMLNYCPNCSVIMFFQPVLLPYYLISRGLLRRFLILYVTASEAERKGALERSLYEKRGVDWELWNRWIVTLTSLSSKRWEWIITDDARKLIFEYVNQLYEYSKSFSYVMKDFAEICYFPLKEYLIRMSCIRAALDNTATVGAKHVSEAFVDLKDFWENSSAFIEDKVVVGARESTSKKELQARKICVGILEQWKAISVETANHSIDDLLIEMQKRLRISKGMCRYHYLKLVKEGIVQTKKGKDTSSVWLNIKEIVEML